MSLTLPTFASGSRIRASDLALITAALNALTPLKARRGSDLTRINTVTPTSDPTLTLSVLANTTYDVQVDLMYLESAAQAVDLRVQFALPLLAVFDATASGPHANWNGTPSTALEVEPAAWNNESGPTTTARVYGTSTTGFGLSVSGTLTVGANAGTFALQWAQGTISAANSVTLKLGSRMKLTPQP